MSTKVAQIKSIIAQDDEAAFVSQLWDTFNMQRAKKLSQWQELRDFIFATDTRTTSAGKLPWSNSTTVPKLCQIRDNLHSNYISALFPNDNWLTWEAFSEDAALKDKAKTITSYMDNKARQHNLRTEISKALLDYIDYGNSFGTVVYENVMKDLPDGTQAIDYTGPVFYRVSPLDIVFDPTASRFKDSWKIIRSLKTLGELLRLAEDQPDQSYWADAVKRRMDIKERLGTFRYEDFEKACGYAADGFGNMYEYFMGGNVEVLEFYGDYLDPKSGELLKNKIITITDRCHVVRIEDIPTWYGGSPFVHVGWRFRPDNLWSMGPLDNLVGMQYRIDHLENAKADAVDLILQPPLKIIGDVEPFVWGPRSEIHLDEGGDVVPLSQNLNHIVMMQNEIQGYEDRMELYAGAPREAMGIRTPGEKTAFEVQSLNNAAGRIFQEKTTNFEVEFLEPILNMMLESAVRNLDGSDVIRVMDDDFGVQEFITITKDDITAKGKLRPVGARHFAKKAQDLQNVIGVFNSPIGQMIAPHTSGKEMANLVADILDLRGYESLFRPNVAVAENAETQGLVGQAQEDQMTQMQMPTAPGV